jgi:hypothetical protein
VSKVLAVLPAWIIQMGIKTAYRHFARGSVERTLLV